MAQDKTKAGQNGAKPGARDAERTDAERPEGGFGVHPTGVAEAADVEQTGTALYPTNPDIPPPNDKNFTPQQPQVGTPPNGIPSNAPPPTQDEVYGKDGQTEDVSVLDGTEGLFGGPGGQVRDEDRATRERNAD